MNHLSLYQTSPTTYIVEIDGKRVSARHVKAEVGLDCVPTVEIELNSESNLEMDGLVLLDDDTILKNVFYKLDDTEFLGKLFEIVERHRTRHKK